MGEYIWYALVALYGVVSAELFNLEALIQIQVRICTFL